MKLLRVALAQMNSTVGDLAGNSKKISDYIKKAVRQKADIIAFPELAFVDADKDSLYNAATVTSEGRIIDVYHKIFFLML